MQMDQQRPGSPQPGHPEGAPDVIDRPPPDITPHPPPDVAPLWPPDILPEPRPNSPQPVPPRVA